MKLYRVNLRGFGGIGVNYGRPYVLANDPSEAYEKVREYLVDKDYGTPKSRELKSIELLAEEGNYPDCLVQVFL